MSEGCLESVLEVSGSCVIDSAFSQLPQIIQNAGVSVGYLEGVSKVSGRCLKGVWGTLDTVWGVIMSNQLMENQLEPF